MPQETRNYIPKVMSNMPANAPSIQQESGSGFIADHAYERPSEVTMECGFAGGGSLLDLVDTSTIGLGLGLSLKRNLPKAAGHSIAMQNSGSKSVKPPNESFLSRFGSGIAAYFGR